MPRFSTLFLSLVVAAACKPTGQSAIKDSVAQADAAAAVASTSAVPEPVARLAAAYVKDGVVDYAGLDARFLSSVAPAGLPVGCGGGTHIAGAFGPNGDPVPAQLRPAFWPAPNANGWHGKCFDGVSMRDIVPGMELPPIRVSLGNLTQALERTDTPFAVTESIRRGLRDLPSGVPATAEGQYTPPLAFAGDQRSLITDYRIQADGTAFPSGTPYDAARMWVDEFRADPKDSSLLLGRSTYNGQFWGYAILYITPTN